MGNQHWPNKQTRLNKIMPTAVALWIGKITDLQIRSVCGCGLCSWFDLLISMWWRAARKLCWKLLRFIWLNAGFLNCANSANTQLFYSFSNNIFVFMIRMGLESLRKWSLRWEMEQQVRIVTKIHRFEHSWGRIARTWFWTLLGCSLFLHLFIQTPPTSGCIQAKKSAWSPPQEPELFMFLLFRRFHTFLYHFRAFWTMHSKFPAPSTVRLCEKVFWYVILLNWENMNDVETV